MCEVILHKITWCFIARISSQNPRSVLQFNSPYLDSELGYTPQTHSRTGLERRTISSSLGRGSGGVAPVVIRRLTFSCLNLSHTRSSAAGREGGGEESNSCADGKFLRIFLSGRLGGVTTHWRGGVIPLGVLISPNIISLINMYPCYPKTVCWLCVVQWMQLIFILSTAALAWILML